MPVAKGTVFACSECGEHGYTRAGCERVLSTLYPIGSMVGEYSTVVALEDKAVRLRCKCGTVFSARHALINRNEREGWRITCGKAPCRCAGRVERRRAHA
jgi:hypothetical protein